MQLSEQQKKKRKENSNNNAILIVYNLPDYYLAKHPKHLYYSININQIYSGITCGRVLNGEIYTYKLYKLINLC